MTDYYDELETRNPAVREGELLNRLPGLIAHAIGNARGWRDRLPGVVPSEVDSRAALATLPVLRKSELGTLQTASPPFGGLVTVEPGELGALYMSPGPLFDAEGTGDDPWRAARALYAAGVRKGHVLQNCFGYHMTPGAWMVHQAARKIGCAIIPAGIGQTEQQLELIKMFKPDAYVGTPSFLRIMIEKAGQIGADISNLKRALVAAEALPPSLRQWFVEQGLEQVLQWYGTADLGLVAYETQAQEGMVLDEELILEIVRPGTGDPVPEGEVGEIVITSFNDVYPMIRFGTGDLSAVLPGISPCGRTNTRIKGWMGRADQATKVRGMFVRPEQVNQIVSQYDAVSKARLVITGEMANDEMTLRCETTDRADGLAEKLTQSLRDVTKLRGEVELVGPGELANDGLVIEDARKYD
ncbi:MAG: phenylacetate--CoA ligase family protein [Burkholderiaceae bacterium]